MKVLKRVAGILGGLLSVVMVLVVVGSIIMVVAQRRSANGIPEIGSYEPLSLLSGSMTPVLRTGDLIIDRSITQAQANNLHVGQIVTYRVVGRTFHGAPMLITHRIVGVFTITNKGTGAVHRSYRTKGDANNDVDPGLVSPSQIVGVYRWRIPAGGYIAAFVHTRPGFLIFVVLPILYFVGGEFLRRWRLIGEQERATAQTAAQIGEEPNQG